MFYCAHLLYTVEYQDQASFPLWENIHLICAENAAAAMEAAEKIGRDGQNLEFGSSYCNDKPSRLVFSGLRRLVEVASDRLESGVELTYIELEVDEREDVLLLLDRKPVKLVFDEPCTARD